MALRSKAVVPLRALASAPEERHHRGLRLDLGKELPSAREIEDEIPLLFREPLEINRGENAEQHRRGAQLLIKDIDELLGSLLEARRLL